MHSLSELILDLCFKKIKYYSSFFYCRFMVGSIRNNLFKDTEANKALDLVAFNIQVGVALDIKLIL